MILLVFLKKTIDIRFHIIVPRDVGPVKTAAKNELNQVQFEFRFRFFVIHECPNQLRASIIIRIFVELSFERYLFIFREVHSIGILDYDSFFKLAKKDRPRWVMVREGQVSVP
jgi:hypothetical protein